MTPTLFSDDLYFLIANRVMSDDGMKQLFSGLLRMLPTHCVLCAAERRLEIDFDGPTCHKCDARGWVYPDQPTWWEGTPLVWETHCEIWWRVHKMDKEEV